MRTNHQAPPIKTGCYSWQPSSTALVGVSARTADQLLETKTDSNANILLTLRRIGDNRIHSAGSGSHA